VPEQLAPLVHYLRHEKVILDSDLAELYGVETGHLNEAVKRNLDRFPSDFMFQLTEDEVKILILSFAASKNAASSEPQPLVTETAPHSLLSQSAIAKKAESSSMLQAGASKGRGGRHILPYAFTEQGVAMLSSVLRSPRAVQVNIAIMRTFVQLRRLMDSNALLAEKIEALEEKYADHDQQFQLVFEAIKQLIAAPSPPTREIGFHSP
jgi:hypothetical protein